MNDANHANDLIDPEDLMILFMFFAHQIWAHQIWAHQIWAHRIWAHRSRVHRIRAADVLP